MNLRWMMSFGSVSGKPRPRSAATRVSVVSLSEQVTMSAISHLAAAWPAHYVTKPGRHSMRR